MPRPGLVVRVEGKKVWEAEHRVDRVRVMGARGEIGAVGISEDDEVIDIIVERAGFLNRRLEDQFAEEQARHREQVNKAAKADPESERALVGVGSKPDEDIQVRQTLPESDSKDTSSGSSSKK